MFLIRENAMKILADLYQRCNSNFQAQPLNNNMYDFKSDEFLKSFKYLIESGCVESDRGLAPSKIMLTIKGIDKAEDYIIERSSQQE